jgi:hypothetical protein
MFCLWKQCQLLFLEPSMEHQSHPNITENEIYNKQHLARRAQARNYMIGSGDQPQIKLYYVV